MTRRRGWIGLAVAALVVIGALALWRAARPGAGGEEAEAASVVPVEVGAVTRATLHRVVTAYGTVEPEPAAGGRPAAAARVGPPLTGVVAEVACAEGETVSRGQVLVRLDSRVADVQIARATDAARFAELAVARQKQMSASEATSQKAIQEAEAQLAAARSELEAARAERELLVVRAPLAGVVVRVAARPGDAVDPAAVLAEIVDLGRLVVAAGVPSADAGPLRVGQPAELWRASDRGARSGATPVAATLAFVGAQVDARNDTVPVRVALPADAGLRPGESVEVRITAEVRADALAVPEDAVVRGSDGGDAVAVVDGDTATLRPVVAGLRERGLVEVTGDGIKEGTAIVTVGAYGLPARTRIRVVGR
ncbi:MAG TPA: efflux RND transporter periplasmic adaptor subunit [Thermoanaerobaculaceae bacterium]|nr:efflux RND transporter periplasmic adaptor subunit [Thermoanaerobaculaceae bacterium]